MKLSRHLSTYALDYCKNFPSYHLSLDFIPFHATETQVTLSSHHFSLKNLGWYLIIWYLISHICKRELELISLILNSLHNWASNTAPRTSQPSTLLLPWSTHATWFHFQALLHTISFACRRLCFPFTYQNTIHIQVQPRYSLPLSNWLLPHQ